MANRALRADARRNYDALVAAAQAAIADHGADASLDDIARRAGVGSGTLYRHFPNRNELLVAVYAHDAAALARTGRQLLVEYPDGTALRHWFELLTTHIATRRGLATAALHTGGDPTTSVCSFHSDLDDTAAVLLEDAQRHHRARLDVTATDLLTMANAVATAGERDAQRAARLLELVFTGVTPR